jgi:hypothetical protein
MMKLNRLLLLLFLIVGKCACAQKTEFTPAEKAALDSMLAEDEFFKMLLENKDSSYFDLGIGVGNGAFSTHNLAENATGTTNHLIFTPAFSYHHKSGFAIGITPFLATDSNHLDLYQTGIAASYDHSGNKADAGISYTRYLSNSKKYNTKSLYQNDLYGYIRRSKGMIQPGIAIGYASGNYKAVDLQAFKRPLLGDTTINDTTHNQASYFSVSASAGHKFRFYKLLAKNDELDFTPSLLLNAGSDKITSTHQNKIFNRRVLNKFKRMESSNTFQLQSVGLSLACIYGVRKFYVQPGVYMDYYIPSTTAKRFNGYFTIAAGISF